MNNIKSQAGEYENNEPTTVSENVSLGSVKNKMEEEDLRAVPVSGENGLKGVIGYRDLIRNLQFKPDKTNLSTVTHSPPSYEKTETVEELCNRRIETSEKLLARTDSENKLVGVFGDKEFRESLKDAELFSHVRTHKISSEDVVTVNKTDSMNRARHKMLDNNISRLPVVDSDGRLQGILRSTDVLKLISKGERRGGSQNGLGYDEESPKDSALKVREFMSRQYQTFNKETDAKKLLEHNSKGGFSEAIKVDERNPVSIATTKDFVKYVSDHRETDTVLVSLTGLEVDEEKASVHNLISTRLQGSIGKKAHRPQRMKARFKKADKDGKRHRYNVNLSLETEEETVRTEVEDYNLLDTVSKGLDKLENQLNT